VGQAAALPVPVWLFRAACVVIVGARHQIDGRAPPDGLPRAQSGDLRWPCCGVQASYFTGRGRRTAHPTGRDDNQRPGIGCRSAALAATPYRRRSRGCQIRWTPPMSFPYCYRPSICLLSGRAARLVFITTAVSKGWRHPFPVGQAECPMHPSKGFGPRLGLTEIFHCRNRVVAGGISAGVGFLLAQSSQPRLSSERCSARRQIVDDLVGVGRKLPRFATVTFASKCFKCGVQERCTHLRHECTQ